MAFIIWIVLLHTQWLILEMYAHSKLPEADQPCRSRFVNPVNMSHCKITKLNPYHFPADLQITTLNMNHNAKFDFPADGSPFLVQNHLKYYHCEHCGITAIYPNTFAELRELKGLYLAANALKTIPCDAFNRNQLQYLLVGGNAIEQINAENELKTMQHLKWLFASGNQNFKLFELRLDFARLEWIKCKQCGLTILSEKWFRQVVELKKLNLEENGITMISRDVFSHNKKITHVYLDGNPLEWLEISSVSLEVLSCVGCNLKELNLICFEALPELKELNLQSNQISSIESTTFTKNSNLSRLILDDNNLTMFPENILFSKILRILCIDDNPLQPSPNILQLKQLYKARKLRGECSAGDNILNQFEHIFPDHSLNGTFFNKKYLPPCNETVDISNRNVAFIYPAVYENCTALTDLIMSNSFNYSFPHHRPFLHSKTLNTYSCIRCGIYALYEQTFSKLPALRMLNLSKTHITKLISFDIFSSNPFLQHLSLESNRLTNLTVQLLSSQTNLITVNLSHNPSLWFDPNLPLMKQLSIVKLEASYCGITTISVQSFRLMPALEEVDISNNPIAEIHPESFNQNRKLRILDISGTHLRMLDATTFAGMHELRRVHLHGLDRYNFTLDVQNNRALLSLLTSRKLNGQKGEQFVALLAASFDNSEERTESSSSLGVAAFCSLSLTCFMSFVRQVIHQIQ